MKIKNQFNPNFNSAQTAGYRDVAINLQLVNLKTAALGVETHVCELQLILLPVYCLKVCLLSCYNLHRAEV
jgi:hypothetical protein